MYIVHVYRIAGNFQRRKLTFTNFKVLWLFAKVSFAKFEGMVSFGSTSEQSTKAFSAKILFSTSLRKFHPAKASRYTVYTKITAPVDLYVAMCILQVCLYTLPDIELFGWLWFHVGGTGWLNSGGCSCHLLLGLLRKRKDTTPHDAVFRDVAMVMRWNSSL